MSEREFIIGVDDTDSLESRGTGYIARSLALHLKSVELFLPRFIVRHQLYFHQDIPFTSHNSSASINGFLLGDKEELISESESFLLNHCAKESDAGFCLADVSNSDLSLICDFGRSAKKSIVTVSNAYELAAISKVYLNGLLGEKIGVIGALAAVGLFSSRCDGRVLWTPNLRDTEGIFIVQEAVRLLGIECILDIDCKVIKATDRLFLSNWTRPVCFDGKITLFVEPSENFNYEYQTASKSFIKSISE